MAEFIDMFVIGEGELPLDNLLRIIRDNPRQDRRSFFAEAVKIPGIYVPTLYDVEYDENGYIKKVFALQDAPVPVERQVLKESPEFASSVIITPKTEFSDMFLTELCRGCPFSCGFCCVSLHNKPYRCAEYKDIINSINMALNYTEKIGLVGAAAGSYPRLAEILDFIKKKGGQVGFSSLRADVLSPGIIGTLKELGQSVLTIAPETGSATLRQRINKTMTDESIYNTVENALSSGFKNLRIYLMLGIPSETDRDVEETVEMLKKIGEAAKITGAKVTASVNQFVPKPGTTLESASLAREEVILHRLRLLKEPFYKNLPVEFKVESTKEALVQAFLASAHRGWSHYLLENYNKSASKFASYIKKLIKTDQSAESLLFNKDARINKFPWKIISGR